MRSGRREALAAWAFAAPALAVITLFFGVPVLAGLALSLTDFDIYALADLHNLRWQGWSNYVQVLSMPLFPEMTEEQARYAAYSLSEVVGTSAF